MKTKADLTSVERRDNAQRIVDAYERADAHLKAVQEELKIVRDAMRDDCQEDYEFAPLDRLDAVVFTIRHDVFWPRFGAWRGYLHARKMRVLDERKRAEKVSK